MKDSLFEIILFVAMIGILYAILASDSVKEESKILTDIRCESACRIYGGNDHTKSTSNACHCYNGEIVPIE